MTFCVDEKKVPYRSGLGQPVPSRSSAVTHGTAWRPPSGVRGLFSALPSSLLPNQALSLVRAGHAPSFHVTGGTPAPEMCCRPPPQPSVGPISCSGTAPRRLGLDQEALRR